MISAEEVQVIDTVHKPLDKEAFDKFEEKRESKLDQLESYFPHRADLVTAGDIMSLHLINTILTDPSFFDAGKESIESEQKRKVLEFEGKYIVRKITQVVARECLVEGMVHPENPLSVNPQIQELLQQFINLPEVMEEVKGNYWGALQVLLKNLGEKTIPIGGHLPWLFDISPESNNVGYQPASDQDIGLALRCAELLTPHKVWKDNCQIALKSLWTDEFDPIKAEQLLNAIHQGNQPNDESAIKYAEPLLDHIAERPSEAENALTYISAGVPGFMLDKIPTRIKKLAMPFRASPYIKPYFDYHSITFAEWEKVYASTEDKPFFRSALVFDKRIPSEYLFRTDPNYRFYLSPGR